MDFKSGIEDAIKNDNDISVRVESGTIVVDSDHDVAIDICDIHGLIVYSGAPATINGLGNGLYIVRAAGKSHKVITRPTSIGYSRFISDSAAEEPLDWLLRGWKL